MQYDYNRQTEGRYVRRWGENSALCVVRVI